MLPFSGGALLVWTNVAPEHEDEFNDWYNRQHLDERVSISGVLRGRRFRALHGRHRYAAFYEAIATAPFGSAEYFASADCPTLRTQVNIARFRDPVRTVQQVIRRVGDDGAIIGTVRVRAGEGEEDRLACAIRELRIEDILARPGLVGAATMREDPVLTASPTKEKLLNAEAFEGADWVILVEGTDLAPVAEAVEAAVRPLRAGNTIDVTLLTHLGTRYSRTWGSASA